MSEELPVLAPFAGTVVAVWHARHDLVRAGQTIVVLEPMKMEHEIVSEVDGTVDGVEVAVGDTVEPLFDSPRPARAEKRRPCVDAW